MTVEAKLRISADLKDARAQVQGLEGDIKKMRASGDDKTNRGQFENLRTSLRQAKEATRELGQAQAEQAKSAGKATAQNLQLSAQLQDFFVQVQAGGSPLTAFIQQGSQLSFIYGGAGNALKAVTSIFTPLRIAAGLAGGAVIALGAAFLLGSQQSANFAKSLQITGGFAGVTAGQFESMAERVSRSVGSSIGGAKETIQGLISTGKFTGSTLEPVATAVEKIAELTGQTREDVVKDFTAMADGGAVKFAEKLNASYNFLDLATYRYIKALQDQGRASEAQIVLADKLNQSLGDISKNLGHAERFWKSIKIEANAAWDAFLGIGRTTTVEDRVAGATKTLEDAQKRLDVARRAGQLAGGGGAQSAVDRAQGDLQEALESKRRAARTAGNISEQKQLEKVKIESESRINKQLEDFASKDFQRKKALAQLDKDIATNNLTPEQQKTIRDGIAEKYKDKAGPKAAQLTRLAQTKQLYDAELELANDAAQRELALLETRYGQGLVSFKDYQAKKTQLQEADYLADRQRLQAQIKAEQATLAANEPRVEQARARGDKNGFEQAEESVLATKQKIAQLQVQLTQREREQVGVTRARLDEEIKITKEITRQFATFEAEQRKAKGERSSPEQAAAQARERYKDLYDKLGVQGDDVGQRKVQQAVSAAARKIQFDEARAQLEQISADLKVREDTIRVADEQAGESTIATERRIISARQDQVAVVQQLIAELAKLADNPEDKTRVAQAQVELSRLKDSTTEVERTLRSASANGMGQFVKDFVTGTKTAGDAFKDFLSNMASQALDLIAQQLGKSLVASFLPGGGGGLTGAAGGGDALGGLISLLGFHSGGVVQPGGQTFTRRIPAGLAAAAAQYAPRYHTGGIAGFKPNERLAVLEKGEEVLTSNDPRHISNLRSSGGVTVSVSTTINAAQGGAGQQQGAADELGGMLEVAIDQWSMKQQRPGGVLYRGGR